MTNQLALFASAAQTEKIASQVKYANQNAEQRLNRIKIIKSILDKNNFVENIHYIYDAKLVDKEVIDGRLYVEGKEFTANWTCKEVKGSIRLMTKYYSTNKNVLKSDTAYIDIEDGKLQVGSITKQYRYYKPSTILTKLKEYNEDQERRYIRANEWTNRANEYASEMKDKYSNAVVSIVKGSKRDYYGKYIETKEVKIAFESGSYIKMNIPEYNYQNITTSVVVDVQEETTEDKLKRFSTQKKES